MYADKSNILTGILRHIHTHTRYIPSQPPHILINRKFLVEETRYIPILSISGPDHSLCSKWISLYSRIAANEDRLARTDGCQDAGLFRQ